MKYGCPTAACVACARPAAARAPPWIPLPTSHAVHHLTTALFLSRPVRPLLTPGFSARGSLRGRALCKWRKSLTSRPKRPVGARVALLGLVGRNGADLERRGHGAGQSESLIIHVAHRPGVFSHPGGVLHLWGPLKLLQNHGVLCCELLGVALRGE